MNTTTCPRTAERLGRWLGRGWRAYARGERRVSARLVAWGLPDGVAFALLWAVKLAVLGLLLYMAFWLALLVAFAFACAGAWAVASGHSAEEEEWPFTDLTELRKMPGYDPNLYNDASHEMYTDD